MVGTLSLCLLYGQVASLAITGRGIVFSRHDVSELCMKPPPSKAKRAQGTPDAGRTREPCVQKRCTLRTQATTGQPNQPAFPAQWFTVYTRSPRCAVLDSHRRPGIIIQGLMPASGH